MTILVCRHNPVKVATLKEDDKMIEFMHCDLCRRTWPADQPAPQVILGDILDA